MLYVACVPSAWKPSLYFFPQRLGRLASGGQAVGGGDGGGEGGGGGGGHRPKWRSTSAPRAPFQVLGTGTRERARGFELRLALANTA